MTIENIFDDDFQMGLLFDVETTQRLLRLTEIIGIEPRTLLTNLIHEIYENRDEHLRSI